MIVSATTHTGTLRGHKPSTVVSGIDISTPLGEEGGGYKKKELNVSLSVWIGGRPKKGRIRELHKTQDTVFFKKSLTGVSKRRKGGKTRANTRSR